MTKPRLKSRKKTPRPVRSMTIRARPDLEDVFDFLDSEVGETLGPSRVDAVVRVLRESVPYGAWVTR